VYGEFGVSLKVEIELARQSIMEVSSVQTPGGSWKLLLGIIEVTKGNENRLWNSEGPPRASTIAVARRQSRILVAEEAGVGT
jgi:hypothetical protein